jgi:hypothetical protein
VSMLRTSESSSVGTRTSGMERLRIFLLMGEIMIITADKYFKKLPAYYIESIESMRQGWQSCKD